MAYFIDSEGKFVEVINQDNFKEFLDFVASEKYVQNNSWNGGSYNDLQHYDFQGINFEEILKTEDGHSRYFSQHAQRYLGDAIVLALKVDRNEDPAKKEQKAKEAEEIAKILLDNAKYFPHLVHSAFHCNGGNDNAIYEAIRKLMPKRKVSENLWAAAAIGPYVEIGKEDKRPDPDYEEVRLFEQLCRNDKFSKNGYSIAEKLILSGYFANAELPAEIRQYHNDVYFAGYNNRADNKLAERIENIDERFLTTRTTADLLFGYSLNNNDGTNIPQKGKHKRKDDFYIRMSAVLMHQARKIKDGAARRGEKKTLNQCFRELIVLLYNEYCDIAREKGRYGYNMKVMKFEQIPPENLGGIIKNLYLGTIIEDIKDGRAADLTKEQLQAALNHDLGKEFLGKIPAELIAKHNLKLTAHQSAYGIENTDQAGAIEYIPYDHYLTLSEKEQALRAVESKQQGKIATEDKLRETGDNKRAAEEKMKQL